MDGDVITETWIDRSTWPSGPWDDEPDRIEWRDPETGLPCLARRHVRAGHWCGYVALPPGHPWHGSCPDLDVEVHGGVTYAGPCDEHGDARERVCHVARPGEPDDVWWLGFDFAHCTDLQPWLLGLDPDLVLPGTTYRTLDYVRAECASVAAQAAALIDVDQRR